MIKAVFFDWFNTLARYEPAREDVAARVLSELGLTFQKQRIRLAMATADRWWFEENTRSPIRPRSREDQSQVYVLYQQAVLHELGVDAGDRPELVRRFIARTQELSGGLDFVLFEEVVPVLRNLKDKGLILGILTNMDSDLTPLLRRLHLEDLVDFAVTSQETGVDKPKPPIFLAALQKGNVGPSEAVHVGDQYGVDIVGARGVGILGLLIDRDGVSEDADCPRLRSLAEITLHLT